MTVRHSPTRGRPLRPRAVPAALALAGLAVAGFGSAPARAGTAAAPAADLRVDADRDGVTDVTPAGATRTGSADDAAEERASALFLPNLDDDRNRCPERGPKRDLLPDATLARCNDAADDVVNGPDDARDLAAVRTVPNPQLPADATGRLELTQPARVTVFLRRGTGWTRVRQSTRFTAAELRAGLELGVEGRDVVRDPAVWDGTVTLVLSVTADGVTSSDLARMRVAPMLSHTPTQRPDTVLVTGPIPDLDRGFQADQRRFVADLRRVVAASGVRGGVRTLVDRAADLWTQDIMEPMYASIPGPDGPRSLRLLLRSDQDRIGGRTAYLLRGRDVGVVWAGPTKSWESRSSFGNLETIPAHSHGGRSYPAGRIVYGTGPAGSPADAMSARLLRMLRAQGMQHPLALDTSFLLVGHVDEMLQFLPADTPRGFRVAVSDPEAGLGLLRRAKAAGRGKALVVDHAGERMTVDQALRAGRVGIVDDNRRAARIIAANVRRVQAATGITDAEVVRVPGLYVDAGYAFPERTGTRSLPPGTGAAKPPSVLGPDGAPTGSGSVRAVGTAAAGPELAALVPGAINGIVLDRSVVVPRQFGVRVAGRDIFADAVSAAYRSAGLTTRFIDGWLYHAGLGEVHCGTNTLRSTATPWWRPA